MTTLSPYSQLTPEALDLLAWEQRRLIEFDAARNVNTVTVFGQTFWAIPADEVNEVPC